MFYCASQVGFNAAVFPTSRLSLGFPFSSVSLSHRSCPSILLYKRWSASLGSTTFTHFTTSNSSNTLWDFYTLGTARLVLAFIPSSTTSNSAAAVDTGRVGKKEEKKGQIRLLRQENNSNQDAFYYKDHRCWRDWWRSRRLFQLSLSCRQDKMVSTTWQNGRMPPPRRSV